MISITTKTTQTISQVLITDDISSELRNETARVSRSKALDGSVVVDHRGFADGDRTFRVIAELDQDTSDDLWYLFRSETLLNISCSEGFFDGAISGMTDKGGQIEFTFLVKG